MTKGLYLNTLWQKYKNNSPDFWSVIFRGYPRFVFDGRVRTMEGQVPVFTFHSVEPDRFESQLKYLKQNGYRTLTADELLAVLRRDTLVPERAVVLTFDDGWGSLWSVAFPLLKQYGYKAAAFVIPGLVEEEPPKSNGPETDRRRLCTWAELRVMQESGVIDIQSHSLSHARVFTSSKVVDFLSSRPGAVSSKFKLAVYQESGQDRWDRLGQPGMPLYESRSLLAGPLRYFDDETLRRTCIQHVAGHGGPDFFSRRGSHRELFKIVRDYRNNRGEQGRFQTADERDKAMVRELEGSKRLIEEKLPGHRVRHLCYPWWNGCDRALELSKEIGYDTNFWGKLPRRAINRPGDDPFHIVRLRDYYLFRLPGEGRKSLLSILTNRSLH
ncbi:MAG: polysaccharide deacetylase family protein [Nitrospirae bacterium]|nr:polysaccharide deacetylase family protein [Nitrospirota bacterium]